MKDFNQKTVLQRLRLHGVVELIRDRAAEDAVRMGMDGVERSGGVLQQSTRHRRSSSCL